MANFEWFPWEGGTAMAGPACLAITLAIVVGAKGVALIPLSEYAVRVLATRHNFTAFSGRSERRKRAEKKAHKRPKSKEGPKKLKEQAERTDRTG
jgi:hypothetical protein